jgi:hypothetical protein
MGGLMLAMQVLMAFIAMALISRLALLCLRWWRNGGRLRLLAAHAASLGLATVISSDALIAFTPYVIATAFLCGIDLGRMTLGLPEITGPIVEPIKQNQ